MKDKLLSVYVNDKEIYYVKRVLGGDIIDDYYGVFNSTNSEIAGYTLDINAFDVNTFEIIFFHNVISLE